MQYTVRTRDFVLTDADRQKARELGISESLLTLLLARGMKVDEIDGFLHPSLDDMASPFEICGMKEAADRIQQAILNKERVLIFGDYDCDGICAISILALYLGDKLDIDYFIPERNKHGYGVSVSALDCAMSKRRPDLIITVDCGITSANEVEYIKSLGIDVIVTDHHEPQASIPDCIVVDAKLERKGFYDYCGAGVALKLVEALSNKAEASQYLDIAAIATIADVVPLTKDNRIIAYYGLRSITRSPRKGIKMLLGEENVTSQDVMFKLAPRMNAAGRLDSAMKVVGLFLENDYFMLRSLADELARDNTKRQEICECVVAEAKAMLKGIDFAETRIITLYSEDWEAGVLGIAAARLTEEFKCPTVLFSKTEDVLKGSARSIKSVNIFELFSELKQYFTAFGGHAQAAGVSMNIQDFEAFKRAANEKLLAEYPCEEFLPKTECEMELPLDMDFLSFAHELQMIEPTGFENPRPNFLVRADGLKFEHIGFTPHIKCTTKNIDLLGFSKFDTSIAATRGEVELEITLGINCFQNNVTAQGIIQSMQATRLNISDSEADILRLHHLEFEGKRDIEHIDYNNISQLLKYPFGTLIVCFSQKEYAHLCNMSKAIAELPVLVAMPRCLNPENCVVISPSRAFEFSYYRQVVIAGKPASEGYLKHIADNSIACVSIGDCTPNCPYVNDDILRAVFTEIANIAAKSGKIASPAKGYAAVSSRIRISESQYRLALMIFEELGLVSIADRGIINISRKKVELSSSVAYRNMQAYGIR